MYEVAGEAVQAVQASMQPLLDKSDAKITQNLKLIKQNQQRIRQNEERVKKQSELVMKRAKERHQQYLAELEEHRA